ncbi:S-formylglutathione hydrolase [Ramlibacter sp. 2FC]|uniref:S-formylglutathione hydrolase n=1 Tax=Ramlibacter sp. 2FC TaxID=2502188 RepID=UPI0010F52E43|nr:S-formylglutathione hydrolase [Ramlibacter sp. 2FC]
MGLELLAEHGCFGGVQRFYSHPSAAIGMPMRFSVFLPRRALQGETCAAVVYLAGLTCTEETFMVKAGAQRVADALGLVLIAPDTSPRGAGIPGETERWDLGAGASFYVDATEAPWARHYRMHSYLAAELPGLLAAELPVDGNRLGIMGHSMGGHGALVLALRNPDRFKSVSAFAPVAAPSHCPWGQVAFTAYLGPDPEVWRRYDACELIAQAKAPPFPAGILVDQGLGDPFLATQLHPHLLEAACAAAGQPLELRRHRGYDHGYYFISTFVEDHLRRHATQLAAGR